MAMVMSISNNENPRFPLDFIGSFGTEEQPAERARTPVRHADRVQDRADGTTGSRSFIATSIFLAEGEDVKVLQANALGHTTFVIRQWLLESLIGGQFRLALILDATRESRLGDAARL
jgi:hypothetical protein